ncbi:hypothetical protein GCM10017783_22200 [Deinococcus piscis]|uniref:Uncharacterized protein n=1 Tax=Deinococcus piscis TaxID=394230 RepID=A0ABQ3K9L5_9DEIO|nr:hypothetical protein [Deinococcus piscis]GHG09120.1 hypothetical protein GCM10017783_22200 [Deinococcus piscis]
MSHDPLHFLLHLRSALTGRASFGRAGPQSEGATRLAALGPWLVMLAALLGLSAPAPREAAQNLPPEQLQQAELPTLERSSALPGRHLKEGQPPQPWPDLPPGRPELPSGLHILPLLTVLALDLPTPQRLAHWGKRQLEGG